MRVRGGNSMIRSDYREKAVERRRGGGDGERMGRGDGKSDEAEDRDGGGGGREEEEEEEGGGVDGD